MPKLVTSSEIHLCGLAPGQHRSKETSQRWQAVGDTVFNLIGPGIKSRPSTPLALPMTARPSSQLLQIISQVFNSIFVPTFSALYLPCIAPDLRSLLPKLLNGITFGLLEALQ